MTSSELFSVEGYGVVVTGGASGLRLAFAEALAENGAAVTILDVDGKAIESEVARLVGAGHDVRGEVVDVTDHARLDAAFDAAVAAHGRLDVAFANAGFGGPRGFGEGDVEHWKAMVLTNVYGAALTIRATREALIETKGHLLLTGSVAGRRALPGSLYSATKWAVTGMGESARQDFNDTGVRVTLIEPGMVDTPFFDNPPEIEALHAEDVARAVLFAVSQPARVDVNEILIRPTDQPG